MKNGYLGLAAVFFFIYDHVVVYLIKQLKGISNIFLVPPSILELP
jgi:hypothetical protein